MGALNRQWIVTFASFTLCSVFVASQDVNAVYRNSYEPNNRTPRLPSEQEPERWKPLSAGWGMPDATSHVGRVFRYIIPADAFRGDISRYEITEADSVSLPSWLYFDATSNAIEGIPSEADIGQYYISVTAFGRKTNSTGEAEITDVFSISVVPDEPSRSSSARPVQDATLDEVTCSSDKIPAVASIILDADWSKLSSHERVNIVNKMSQFSRLKVGAFTLVPRGRKSSQNQKALVLGPGNVKVSEFMGVSLSWTIGCGEGAANLPVVTVLEGAAKDGSMAKKFAHNIIGWQVTGAKSKPIVRVRRQAALAGTPLPTPVPSVRPTSVIETSVMPTSRVVPSETSTVMTSMLASPSVKVSKTKVISTPVATPTPTSSPIIIQPTPTPSEAPTRTFSPPMPTTSLTAVSEMTSTPMLTPTSSAESTSIVPSFVPTSIAPSKSKPPIVPTKVPPVNKHPTIGKKFKRIDAFVNVPLVFVIPADTFRDEDGDTRKLNIQLLSNDDEIIPDTSWLKFDPKTQTLHGYPTDPVRESYVLLAQDKQGLRALMPFDVVVTDASSTPVDPPPVAMGTTLNIDFDDFINNIELQLDVLNRIASVFGDPDASSITITGIRRGSVVLTWTNNTINKDDCPTELINEIMSKLVDENGKPSQALIDAFAPEYTISGVDVMEAGPCKVTTTMRPTTPEPKKTPLPVGKDSWITSVLPFIAVAILLLIIGVIILVLYRKNRKGKMSDEDQNTFLNKGIPIILPDEMEESEKPPNTTAPLIMNEEKPPLPPPDYNGIQDGSREPLLNGNDNHTRAATSSDEDDKNSLPMADMSGSPPYQKPDPPSSTPTDNKKQAPVNTPAYRAPPAYVPP